MAVPSTTAQWTMTPRDGFDGLKYDASAAIPALGPKACLVRVSAVSLNYRDIAMPLGKYPAAYRDTYIPCSDGAGEIVAIGADVRLHRVGDRVVTLFIQGHQSGRSNPAIRQTGLGSVLDGVLREYGVFEETGLVAMPQGLSMREAATLPCAAVTAWNALMGLEGRQLAAGEYVLAQGTGGVSLFAVQIAAAMGAKVIATTSSGEKEEVLRKLGAEHVVNYREDAKWGATVKGLTPGKEGVHHIVEVGGDTTVAQSLEAIRCEGVISIIGFLGGKNAEARPSLGDCLRTLSIVRGVQVGSRVQAEELHAFVSKHQIKPVLDEKVFTFKQAREAFEYLQSQKHLGKVVIDVASD